MTGTSRRSFLARTAAATGGALLGGSALQALPAAAHTASPRRGATTRKPMKTNGDVGYGPLAPVPDQNGDAILALPEGFAYVTFSKIGDMMSDGNVVPRAHDGMAAFRGPRGTTRLIRNHEVRTAPGTAAGAVHAATELKYDVLGVGGTTSIDFDTRSMTMVADWASVAGTIVNCAGGIVEGPSSRNGKPVMGWMTSEETVAGPNNGWAQKHGYNFFVPADADGPVAAVPLIAMGRMAHEAVAQDPITGYIYETEDSGNDSGFYRFRPHDRRDLLAGGTLEMLGIAGTPGFSAITGQTEGVTLAVVWIPIDDPDPDLESGAAQVADQGIAGGAAMFNRLEGIWWDQRSKSFFFNSTSGGDAGYGQVWQYHPKAETLTLFFESTGGSVLDSPDNLLVTPRGGILLCEDDASGDDDLHPLAPGITDVNRLVGLSRAGEAFEFAVNRLNGSEPAGACFSPDGQVLFFNLFGAGDAPGSGMTVAVTGPWHRGPL
jgi:secreted PhoX family phosphatase